MRELDGDLLAGAAAIEEAESARPEGAEIVVGIALPDAVAKGAAARPETAQPEAGRRPPEGEGAIAQLGRRRVADVYFAQATADQQLAQPLPLPIALGVVAVLAGDADVLYAGLQQLVEDIGLQQIAVGLDRQSRFVAVLRVGAAQDVE